MTSIDKLKTRMENARTVYQLHVKNYAEALEAERAALNGEQPTKVYPAKPRKPRKQRSDKGKPRKIRAARRHDDTVIYVDAENQAAKAVAKALLDKGQKRGPKEPAAPGAVAVLKQSISSGREESK